MIRVNVNALIDDFEQASGSCEIESKKATEKCEDGLAAFLAGAACALDVFPRCRKPEDFGTLIAVEFNARNGVLDG